MEETIYFMRSTIFLLMRDGHIRNFVILPNGTEKALVEGILRLVTKDRLFAVDRVLLDGKEIDNLHYLLASQ